jgi:hypothetical protein
MYGRRAVVGLSLLCALVFCAFAAPSAQALKGTTITTCKQVGSGATFQDEHCTKQTMGAAQDGSRKTLPRAP